jgi:hypothetical protein
MTSNPIETAPKNEELIVLLGESNDVFEIGRWSARKSTWVGQDGAPVRIKPTHWFEPDPSWLATTSLDVHATRQAKKVPRRRRFGLYAVVAILAWSALFELLRFVESPSREDVQKFLSTGASAVLEVLRFVEPPIRENFEKIFSSSASVEPQTVADKPVAGADMAKGYVRTAPESEAVIENTYAQASAKSLSNTPPEHAQADAIPGALPQAGEQLEAATRPAAETTSADAAASHELRQERLRIDALIREVAALREELEAIKARFAAPSAPSADRAPEADVRSAAEPDDAQGTLLLAATYDPNPLERFRVNGWAADKAQFWYETAMFATFPSGREGSNPWPPGQ